MSPDVILQFLHGDQVYCLLAMTPGVLVPCQRQWSPNREGTFTKIRHAKKLNMDTSNFLSFLFRIINMKVFCY